MTFGKSKGKVAGSRILSVLLSVLMLLQIVAPAGATSAEENLINPQGVPGKIVPAVKNVPGEYIVHFKKGIAKEAKSKTIKSANAEVMVQEKKEDRIVLIKATKGEDPKRVSAKLKQDPSVEYIEPNYLLSTVAGGDEPMYSDQWGMSEVNAEDGWEAAREHLAGGNPTPVTVAVIDTGVDAEHEDLVGKVVPGRNMITGANNPENTSDDSPNGHGTHVAGVIAAVYDNGIGISGLAGGLPVKILPVKTLDSTGTGTLYDVSQSIRWAVDNGAEVINLSLGARIPDYPLTLDLAVKYALEQGVLVVAAAGNDGSSMEGFYPACLPGVISVGATGLNHQPADFSNYGARFLAPGVDILSTLPGNNYGEMSGTSMAAPFVSAIAATMCSVFPGKTIGELTAALDEGRRAFSYNCRYNYYWSYICDYIHIVNLHYALDELNEEHNSMTV